MHLARYRKAVVAALGGMVGIIALWAPGVEMFATPELINTIAGALTALLVYAVPNAD